MSRRRGSSNGAVLMVIFGLTAVLMLGYGFRDTERSFADRTRCRAAARWAAESAVERGRALVARGGAPSRLTGDLEGATYSLVATPASGGWNFVATGTCEEHGARVEQRAHVTLRRVGGRWEVATYQLMPGADS
ncbi:MAG: hypothetical protein RMA76_15250 [Deltaproteobacteria bacterium]|jgi:hypothetical protein